MTKAKEKLVLRMAEIIRQQILSIGKSKVASWGVNSSKCGITAENNPFLAFKVNGLLHAGIVQVVYMPDDTYTVIFFNQSNDIVNKMDDVYCMELGEKIDLFVEYTGDDESYRKELEKRNLI